MPHHHPDQSNEASLNPQDLFAFLATYDLYPVSGQRLAEQARASGASAELTRFFEAIPGTLSNESDIVKHAMRSDQPPYGQMLDLSTGGGPAPTTSPDIPKDQATLELSDLHH